MTFVKSIIGTQYIITYRYIDSLLSKGKICRGKIVSTSFPQLSSSDIKHHLNSFPEATCTLKHMQL